MTVHFITAPNPHQRHHRQRHRLCAHPSRPAAPVILLAAPWRSSSVCPRIPGGIPATAVANLGVTTGSVASVTVAPGSAGYTSVPTVTFSAPCTSVANGGVTATGTAVLSTSTGPISAITVTSGGAGYGVAPTVTIAAPTTLGSIQAVGTATVTSGVVTGITLAPAGTGYTGPPQVTIAPPPPATATATLTAGAVSSVTVTNGQIGYTAATIPSVTFSG